MHVYKKKMEILIIDTQTTSKKEQCNTNIALKPLPST